MTDTAKRKLVWGLVLLLGILHYDFWWWNDTSVVFGFMPIGLAWHAFISVAAAVAWWLVIKFSWPGKLEEWADAGDEAGGEAS